MLGRSTSSPREIYFIGGGVRSGKSRYAVELATRLGERRAFVATATTVDAEMEARIERHRVDRSGAFDTFEAPWDLEGTLQSLDAYDVVVIDCVTLWLAGQLVQHQPPEAILAKLDAALARIRERRWHAILVSNEVGMSVHPPTEIGRAFVDLCGFAHQRIAKSADRILLAIMGTVIQLAPTVQPAP